MLLCFTHFDYSFGRDLAHAQLQTSPRLLSPQEFLFHQVITNTLISMLTIKATDQLMKLSH